MSDLDAVRDSAEREADARVLGDRPEILGYSVEDAFGDGAVWLAGKLPTREEIAAMLEEHAQCIDWGLQEPEDACWCGWDGGPDEFPSHIANAVLALLQERISGEASGS